MIVTWREAKALASDPKWIPFTKERLVHHSNQLYLHGLVSDPISVKNIPDIIYSFRAREDLPEEIISGGNVAIIGCGKGAYAFAAIDRPNRISLPKAVSVKKVVDAVPDWARAYMGDDEQGNLTKIASNHLIRDYLSLKDAFRLQSHLRMGVPKYGQVEVDEIYVGITQTNESIIIGVEAKDKSEKDLLNVSQLFGTSQALMNIFKNSGKRLIGVKPRADGSICLCEFAVAATPAQVKEVGSWQGYMLT